MLSDKEIKKQYRPKFWAEPEKFYASEVLCEEGYSRSICTKCGKPFWAMDADRPVCGDPACSPGESFAFIGNTPAGRSMDYIEIWTRFAKMFEGFGYTPIARYPAVARWNPTMEYTNASIAAFQPFVIAGEMDPPANPLVIPQFCLRFSDIDNVGITMSHNTGFVMIGQHMFVPPEQWDQNAVFRHIQTWLKDGLKLPNEEVVFAEDAWAGGGNFGCCMEFFSRGCELGNQVYMLYEQTPAGVRDLNLKVLDMGMGMERNAWFSQGCNTMYDAQFPTVMNKLLKRTGVEYDDDLLRRYVPYAGLLNLDEVEDIQAAWRTVAENVGSDVDELRTKIIPLSGVYSIAEHTRSLLVTLSDGALPSNVGGGYNLRILARRALGFIIQQGWDLHLAEVCAWHADYLKPVFPELSENLDEVEKILDVERTKYEAMRRKTASLVARIVKEDVTTERLLELYDSNGIPPDLVAAEAKKLDRTINVPEDFYTRVAELHETREQVHATKKEEVPGLDGLPDTRAEYFGDWKELDFTANVLRVKDAFVVLDTTRFYPTSGGQIHDVGTLNGEEVVGVQKQGGLIVHVMKAPPSFSEGDSVKGQVDEGRRRQLAQHHTAAHIINAAARRILGRHINQAGAKKTLERAHLDVTHFQAITDDELARIEEEANSIVGEDIVVKKGFYARDQAEKKYGMAIYQGGAVPGKSVRVVEVPSVDIEACGGTHLNSTGEVGPIHILKTKKIQDGVVRILFTAGGAASHSASQEETMLAEAAEILDVDGDQVPARADELFRKWKKVRKSMKKRRPVAEEQFMLTAGDRFDGDALARTAEIFRVQPEHVAKTAKRFLDELMSMRDKVEIATPDEET